MRKFILCFMLFVLCCNQSFSIDYNLLRERINQQTLSNIYSSDDKVLEIILLSDSGRYIDDSIKDLYLKILLPPGQMQEWMGRQQPDGSWSDINYNDRNRSFWQPLEHLIRLHHFCKHYYSADSPLKGSRRLMTHIRSGLTYWITTNPKAVNWWFNEIGANKILAPILLLLQDDLDEHLKLGGVRILAGTKLGKAGQNKIWIAGIVLCRAILEKDDTLLLQAYSDIASEIKYAHADEGLQSDFSYHLHGPQLQLGNYGLAYALSMSYWANVFDTTSLAFSPQQKELLYNYATKGLYPTFWNGYMDFSAIGRHFFPDTQHGKGIAFEQVLTNMKFVGGSLDDKPQHAVYYFRSDYLVHITDRWAASVRMSSPRVQGSESGNGENLKGYYLGDGVMSLRMAGDEYENIFPVWDWRKLPGATIPQSDNPLPVLTWDGYRNGSDFVGGLSDGTNSMVVFTLDRDGVYGKKSYFFFKDKIICLGTQLHSAGNLKLVTTINQTKWEGEVEIRQKRKRSRLSKATTLELTPPLSLSHADICYNLETGNSATLSIEEREGNWGGVVSAYKSKNKKQDVFQLTIADKDGDYAYSIYPTPKNNKTPVPSHHVVRNDKRCQSVVCTKDNIAQAVFYTPDSITMPDGVLFTAMHPLVCLYTGGTIWVADPTQKQDQVAFSLEGQYKNGAYDPTSNRTVFTVALPGNEYKGSSVEIELHKK